MKLPKTFSTYEDVKKFAIKSPSAYTKISYFEPTSGWILTRNENGNNSKNARQDR